MHVPHLVFVVANQHFKIKSKCQVYSINKICKVYGLSVRLMVFKIFFEHFF